MKKYYKDKIMSDPSTMTVTNKNKAKPVMRKCTHFLSLQFLQYLDDIISIFKTVSTILCTFNDNRLLIVNSMLTWLYEEPGYKMGAKLLVANL